MGNKIDRYEIESKMLKMRKDRAKMQKERGQKCNEYYKLTGNMMIRKPIDDYIDRSVPPNQIQSEIKIGIQGVKPKQVKKKREIVVHEEEVKIEIEEEEEEEEEEEDIRTLNKKKFKNNDYCSYS